MPEWVDTVETTPFRLWPEQLEELIERREPKLHGFICWVVLCPEAAPPLGFVVAVPRR
jgi:hypothetical protein